MASRTALLQYDIDISVDMKNVKALHWEITQK